MSLNISARHHTKHVQHFVAQGTATTPGGKRDHTTRHVSEIMETTSTSPTGPKPNIVLGGISASNNSFLIMAGCALVIYFLYKGAA